MLPLRCESIDATLSRPTDVYIYYIPKIPFKVQISISIKNVYLIIKMYIISANIYLYKMSIQKTINNSDFI